MSGKEIDRMPGVDRISVNRAETMGLLELRSQLGFRHGILCLRSLKFWGCELGYMKRI